jgi:hypothetical protein
MANEYTNEQKVTDYQTLFTSEVGVRVLADLDRQCKYRKDLFDPDSERVTSFNLGQNAVVRYIHSQMEKKTETKEQEMVINKGVNLNGRSETENNV